MKKFGQGKLVGQVSVTALTIVALVFVAARAAIGSGGTLDAVVSGPAFSISSTISSSAIGQISAVLDPGAPRYLRYTVKNPSDVAISVDSLSISGTTAPSGCSIDNLNLGDTTFSGSLVVPALGTNSVSVPISLLDTSTNQDSCENTAFDFIYSGSATYIEVYATATEVTSSKNPSAVGEGVTYTATVTASAAPDQDLVPSSPTGTVTFLDGPTAICTDVLLTGAGMAASTATCSSSVYTVAGTYFITAVYSNADANFSDSTSSQLPQVTS